MSFDDSFSAFFASPQGQGLPNPGYDPQQPLHNQQPHSFQYSQDPTTHHTPEPNDFAAFGYFDNDFHGQSTQQSHQIDHQQRFTQTQQQQPPPQLSHHHLSNTPSYQSLNSSFPQSNQSTHFPPAQAPQQSPQPIPNPSNPTTAYQIPPQNALVISAYLGNDDLTFFDQNSFFNDFEPQSKPAPTRNTVNPNLILSNDNFQTNFTPTPVNTIPVDDFQQLPPNDPTPHQQPRIFQPYQNEPSFDQIEAQPNSHPEMPPTLQSNYFQPPPQPAGEDQIPTNTSDFNNSSEFNEFPASEAFNHFNSPSLPSSNPQPTSSNRDSQSVPFPHQIEQTHEPNWETSSQFNPPQQTLHASSSTFSFPAFTPDTNSPTNPDLISNATALSPFSPNPNPNPNPIPLTPTPSSPPPSSTVFSNNPISTNATPRSSAKLPIFKPLPTFVPLSTRSPTSTAPTTSSSDNTNVDAIGMPHNPTGAQQQTSNQPASIPQQQPDVIEAQISQPDVDLQQSTTQQEEEPQVPPQRPESQTSTDDFGWGFDAPSGTTGDSDDVQPSNDDVIVLNQGSNDETVADVETVEPVDSSQDQNNRSINISQRPLPVELISPPSNSLSLQPPPNNLSTVSTNTANFDQINEQFLNIIQDQEPKQHHGHSHVQIQHPTNDHHNQHDNQPILIDNQTIHPPQSTQVPHIPVSPTSHPQSLPLQTQMVSSHLVSLRDELTNIHTEFLKFRQHHIKTKARHLEAIQKLEAEKYELELKNQQLQDRSSQLLTETPQQPYPAQSELDSTINDIDAEPDGRSENEKNESFSNAEKLALLDQLAQLQAQIDTLSADNAILKQESSQLKQMNDELTTTNGALIVEIDQLSTQKLEFESTLRATQDSQNEAIASLQAIAESNQAQLQDQLGTLQNHLESRDQQLQSLQDQYTERETDFQTQFQALQESYTDVQTQYSALYNAYMEQCQQNRQGSNASGTQGDSEDVQQVQSDQSDLLPEQDSFVITSSQNASLDSTSQTEVSNHATNNSTEVDENQTHVDPSEHIQTVPREEYMSLQSLYDAVLTAARNNEQIATDNMQILSAQVEHLTQHVAALSQDNDQLRAKLEAVVPRAEPEKDQIATGDQSGGIKAIMAGMVIPMFMPGQYPPPKKSAAAAAAAAPVEEQVPPETAPAEDQQQQELNKFPRARVSGAVHRESRHKFDQLPDDQDVEQYLAIHDAAAASSTSIDPPSQNNPPHNATTNSILPPQLSPDQFHDLQTKLAILTNINAELEQQVAAYAQKVSQQESQTTTLEGGDLSDEFNTIRAANNELSTNYQALGAILETLSREHDELKAFAKDLEDEHEAMAKLCETAQTSAKSLESTLSALQTQNQQLSDENQLILAQSMQYRVDLTSSQEAVVEQSQQIFDLTSTISHLEEAATKYKEQVEQLTHTVGELRNEQSMPAAVLKERLAEIAAKDAQIAGLQAAIVDRQGELSSAFDQVNEARDQSKSLSKQLTVVQSTLEDQLAVIANKDEVIKRKDVQMGELRTQLEKTIDSIQSLKDTAASDTTEQYKAELADKARQLADKDVQLASKKQSLKEKKTIISQQDAKIKELLLHQTLSLSPTYSSGLQTPQKTPRKGQMQLLASSPLHSATASSSPFFPSSATIPELQLSPTNESTASAQDNQTTQELRQKLKDHIAQLQEKISYQVEREDLVRSQSREIDTLQVELTNKGLDINQLNQTIDAKKASIQQLDNSLAENATQIAHLNKTIQERDILIQVKDNELQKVYTNLAEKGVEIMQHLQAIAALEKSQTSLQSTVSSQIDQLAAKSAEITHLQSDLTQLTSEHNSLKIQKAQLDLAIDARDNDVVLLEAQIVDLQSNITHYQSLLVTTSHKLQHLQQSCDDLELSLESSQAKWSVEHTNLAEEQAKRDLKIQDLTAALDEKNKDISEMESNVIKLASTLHDIHTVHDSLQGLFVETPNEEQGRTEQSSNSQELLVTPHASLPYDQQNSSLDSPSTSSSRAVDPATNSSTDTSVMCDDGDENISSCSISTPATETPSLLSGSTSSSIPSLEQSEDLDVEDFQDIRPESAPNSPEPAKQAGTDQSKSTNPDITNSDGKLDVPQTLRALVKTASDLHADTIKLRQRLDQNPHFLPKQPGEEMLTETSISDESAQVVPSPTLTTSASPDANLTNDFDAIKLQVQLESLQQSYSALIEAHTALESQYQTASTRLTSSESLINDLQGVVADAQQSMKNAFDQFTTISASFQTRSNTFAAFSHRVHNYMKKYRTMYQQYQTTLAKASKKRPSNTASARLVKKSKLQPTNSSKPTVGTSSAIPEVVEGGIQPEIIQTDSQTSDDASIDVAQLTAQYNYIQEQYSALLGSYTEQSTYLAQVSEQHNALISQYDALCTAYNDIQAFAAPQPSQPESVPEIETGEQDNQVQVATNDNQDNLTDDPAVSDSLPDENDPLGIYANDDNMSSDFDLDDETGEGKHRSEMTSDELLANASATISSYQAQLMAAQTSYDQLVVSYQELGSQYNQLLHAYNTQQSCQPPSTDTYRLENIPEHQIKDSSDPTQPPDASPPQSPHSEPTSSIPPRSAPGLTDELSTSSIESRINQLESIHSQYQQLTTDYSTVISDLHLQLESTQQQLKAAQSEVQQLSQLLIQSHLDVSRPITDQSAVHSEEGEEQMQVIAQLQCENILLTESLNQAQLTLNSLLSQQSAAQPSSEKNHVHHHNNSQATNRPASSDDRSVPRSKYSSLQRVNKSLKAQLEREMLKSDAFSAQLAVYETALESARSHVSLLFTRLEPLEAAKDAEAERKIAEKEAKKQREEEKQQKEDRLRAAQKAEYEKQQASLVGRWFGGVKKPSYDVMQQETTGFRFDAASGRYIFDDDSSDLSDDDTDALPPPQPLTKARMMEDLIVPGHQTCWSTNAQSGHCTSLLTQLRETSTDFDTVLANIEAKIQSYQEDGADLGSDDESAGPLVSAHHSPPLQHPTALQEAPHEVPASPFAGIVKKKTQPSKAAAKATDFDDIYAELNSITGVDNDQASVPRRGRGEAKVTTGNKKVIQSAFVPISEPTTLSEPVSNLDTLSDNPINNTESDSGQVNSPQTTTLLEREPTQSRLEMPPTELYDTASEADKVNMADYIALQQMYSGFVEQQYNPLNQAFSDLSTQYNQLLEAYNATATQLQEVVNKQAQNGGMTEPQESSSPQIQSSPQADDGITPSCNNSIVALDNDLEDAAIDELSHADSTYQAVGQTQPQNAQNNDQPTMKAGVDAGDKTPAETTQTNPDVISLEQNSQLETAYQQLCQQYNDLLHAYTSLQQQHEQQQQQQQQHEQSVVPDSNSAELPTPPTTDAVESDSAKKIAELMNEVATLQQQVNTCNTTLGEVMQQLGEYQTGNLTQIHSLLQSYQDTFQQLVKHPDLIKSLQNYQQLLLEQQTAMQRQRSEEKDPLSDAFGDESGGSTEISQVDADTSPEIPRNLTDLAHVCSQLQSQITIAYGQLGDQYIQLQAQSSNYLHSYNHLSTTYAQLLDAYNITQEQMADLQQQQAQQQQQQPQPQHPRDQETVENLMQQVHEYTEQLAQLTDENMKLHAQVTSLSNEQLSIREELSSLLIRQQNQQQRGALTEPSSNPLPITPTRHTDNSSKPSIYDDDYSFDDVTNRTKRNTALQTASPQPFSSPITPAPHLVSDNIGEFTPTELIPLLQQTIDELLERVEQAELVLLQYQSLGISLITPETATELALVQQNNSPNNAENGTSKKNGQLVAIESKSPSHSQLQEYNPAQTPQSIKHLQHNIIVEANKQRVFVEVGRKDQVSVVFALNKQFITAVAGAVGAVAAGAAVLSSATGGVL